MWDWGVAHEPLRVDGVGLGEDSGPLLADGVGMPVVDVGGGVHPDAAVAVGVVVPGEEGDEERAGVLDAGEAVGEVGPVLQGLGLSNKRCIWGCFRGQWEWADRRPLKVMSKALRALFQRWVHRALPLPVGSRAMTAM